ncbi:MAG TPA: 4Fe-4S dicluster domain-containing protein [Bacteroidales bacterium]|nr:4Fe-4S dicluster domain-containing protein [Bacteroidales bacterium]
MNKFGFTISKGRQIEFDSNDRSIAEYILFHEPSYRLCIECGGCAATCTTGNFTPFSLREMNILLKRGENDSVKKNISRCMLCGKCSLVCPRGVNTRNVITLAMQAFRKSEGHAI